MSKTLSWERQAHTRIELPMETQDSRLLLWVLLSTWPFEDNSDPIKLIKCVLAVRFLSSAKFTRFSYQGTLPHLWLCIFLQYTTSLL
jgi:hypothetical protein